MSRQQTISIDHATSKEVSVKGLTTRQIVQQYGVSRITAWRGTKCGHIHLNYHIRNGALYPLQEEVTKSREKQRKCDEKQVVNMTALQSYDELRPIARGVWVEMLRGQVTFQDFWDVAWDYILGSRCEHLNFWAWAKAVFRNAAFHVMRHKRRHIPLGEINPADTLSVDVGEVEITNALEVAN
jgi:hypothetical protein